LSAEASKRRRIIRWRNVNIARIAKKEAEVSHRTGGWQKKRDYSEGDSMRDAGILDGDYVLVRLQPQVENGAVAVVYLGEEATVKRLWRTRHGYRLQPENPTAQGSGQFPCYFQLVDCDDADYIRLQESAAKPRDFRSSTGSSNENAATSRLDGMGRCALPHRWSWLD
jgi:hypothetical protein